MTEKAKISNQRCTRCGRVASQADKFCAECGLFLRDAHVDQRLLLALVHEREGRSGEARYELRKCRLRRRGLRRPVPSTIAIILSIAHGCDSATNCA